MIEQHRKAMKFAQEGFLLIKTNPSKAKSLFTKAFEIEKKVAMSFHNNENSEPIRSILFRSAAALAKHSGRFQELQELVSTGLSGNPTKEIFEELLNLLMNENQQDFCYSSENFIRLLAPAGSGKTTALLWRCLNQLTNHNQNSKFLVFTFTRVARDELKNRINNTPELRKLKDKIKIETLNQWGFNYVKNIKNGIDLKTSKNDFHFLVKNNLRPQWEDKPVVGRLSETYQIGSVINIFSELKTLGFNHSIEQRDFMDAFIEHYGWLENNGLGAYFTQKVYDQVKNINLLSGSRKSWLYQLEPFLIFWKKCTDELWNQSILTLEDQKYWALRVLEKQYPNGELFPKPNRYTDILVDEFQDINPLDLALINKLCKVCESTLTIVGDDDQAIYEWRGSSPKFIVNPDQFLSKKFKTVILETNYRSPRNIVEYSQTLIKLNKSRVPKNIEAFSDDDAEILIKPFTNHIECLPFIFDAIKETLITPGRSLAVISRKKGQLVPLQIYLTSNDIPYFAKEDLNILFSKAFNDLKKILVTVVEKNQRKNSESISNEIMSLCNLVKKYPLNKIDYKSLHDFIMKAKPKTLVEAVQVLSKFSGKLKSISSDSFRNAIVNVLDTKNVAATIQAVEDNFEGLQKHYAKGEDDIFYKEPPFLYLSEYAERYKDDYWSFIDHIETAISKMTDVSNGDLEKIDDELKNPIHLMTALRAKGKEFDTVIVLDVNDGLWPIKQAETEEQLEQERRLFYVAITRTKRKLILLTVNTIHDKPFHISPYINEMGLL